MKHSIKDIFKNLSTYLFFVFFVAFLSGMLILEQQLSFDKVDNLNSDKKIATSLINANISEMELALIKFNAQSAELLQNVEELKVLYKYSIFEKYLLHNSDEYLADLRNLSVLITKFNEATHRYYIQSKDLKKQIAAKKELDNAYNTLISHIDKILLKSLYYSEEKFQYIKYFFIISFILILLATFWYRKALNSIYADISYLFKLETNKSDYEIFSLEADGIALRMNRKNQVIDNPNLIDPVTNINNHKGLLHSYAHKKSLKDSNFTSVAVLEIDNFSKSKRVYTQEVAQAMLKKVAYTISLHEQPVDVIARTDYNQFTVILSRASKEQAFKEIDLIRESISELKFNIPDVGPVTISVSGGFVIKPNNTSLEEAMKQAKEILEYAKSTGKNKIFQVRDLAHKEM